jgi:hypothetical protein
MTSPSTSSPASVLPGPRSLPGAIALPAFLFLQLPQESVQNFPEGQPSLVFARRGRQAARGAFVCVDASLVSHAAAASERALSDGKASFVRSAKDV